MENLKEVKSHRKLLLAGQSVKSIIDYSNTDTGSFVKGCIYMVNDANGVYDNKGIAHTFDESLFEDFFEVLPYKSIFVSVEQYLKNDGKLYPGRAIYDMRKKFVIGHYMDMINDYNIEYIENRGVFSKQQIGLLEETFVEVVCNAIYSVE